MLSQEGAFRLIEESEVYDMVNDGSAAWNDCVRELYIDDDTSWFAYRNKYATEKDDLNTLDADFAIALYQSSLTKQGYADGNLTEAEDIWAAANATLTALET